MFEDNQFLEDEGMSGLFPSNYDGIFDDETIDKDVQEVASKCSREGKLSDLVKLELKTKIQLGKHKKGESFHVEWRQPDDNNQLTPEDLERRKDQRERNNLSARKHRLKKKEEKAQMKKEMIRLEEKNVLLKQTVRELESLKDKLYEGFSFLLKTEAV